MDSELLKTFIEVTKTRHFGKAAENLFVTQSAVSARIRHLEERLGVDLFARNRNDIQLTPSGLKLLEPAQHILDVWQKARNEITLQQEGKITLSVGCIASLCDMFLSKWLGAIYQRLNDITVNMEIHSSEVLRRKLLDKSLDLTLMFEAPEAEALETRKITRIPLCLVSSKSDMQLSAAIVENYILVDWGTSFAAIHARKFAEALPMMRVGLGQIAVEYLLEERGSAYLALPMVQHYIETGKLFLVKDAPIIEHTAYAAYHIDNDKQKLVKQCLSLLLSKQSFLINE